MSPWEKLTRLWGRRTSGKIESFPLTEILDDLDEGFTLRGGAVIALCALFPALTEEVVCPNCYVVRRLKTQIMHLNDEHGWERTRIADWLDALPYDLRVPAAGRGD